MSTRKSRDAIEVLVDDMVDGGARLQQYAIMERGPDNSTGGV